MISRDLPVWRPRRPNPVFTDENRALVAVLVRARLEVGLSQRDLSAAVDRSASHIARIECGQRRLDVLQFYEFALALDRDPAALFQEAARAVAEVRQGAAS